MGVEARVDFPGESCITGLFVWLGFWVMSVSEMGSA